MLTATRSHFLGALLLALASSLACAADTPPPTDNDPMAAARTAVKANRWALASDELRKLNASGGYAGNADWNNLMGYVSRKQSPPDIDAAQRYYDAALRIDPKHLGALEYSGELALVKRDLATAEARLATLAGLCRSPCEQLDDLKKSVDRYKAANKG